MPDQKHVKLLLLVLIMLLTGGAVTASANININQSNIIKSSDVYNYNLSKSYDIAQAEAEAETQNTNQQSSQSPRNFQKLNRSYWERTRYWLYQKQAEINSQLAKNLQKFKETNDLHFAAILIFASFLYGLVHAAGPGHGKVVVSSYIVANQQTMKRGIILAFLSAFMQGSTAILLVGTLVYFFEATGKSIREFGQHLTQISFLMIIALGVYLLISSLRRHYKLFLPEKPGTEHAAGHHEHHHENCGCNHKHMPDASELEGDWDLGKITSLVLSVGLRPCSGALYILAFALVKGVFWVGAVSVYAMALGTAITISVITIAVVSGRKVAFLSTKENSRSRMIMSALISMAGALVIILFGSVLLSSTFTPARPF